MAMSQPAVLSGAMLARKGAAVPSGYTPMRPRDISSAGSAAGNAARNASQNAGDPAPASGCMAAAVGGPPPAEGERTRVSVRLDRERHFKLKLTAAHLESSLQDVITDALDRYLEQLGPEVLRNDCACLGMKSGGMKSGGLKNGAVQRGWQSD